LSVDVVVELFRRPNRQRLRYQCGSGRETGCLSRSLLQCAVVWLSTRRCVTGNDPARILLRLCDSGSRCCVGGARRPAGKMTQRCAVAGSDSRPRAKMVAGNTLRRTASHYPCTRTQAMHHGHTVRVPRAHARRAMLCVARGLCGLYGPCGPYWQAVQAGVLCNTHGSKAARRLCSPRRDCVYIHTQPFLFAPPAQNYAFKPAQLLAFIASRFQRSLHCQCIAF
jgi:hypothetical protein